MEDRSVKKHQQEVAFPDYSAVLDLSVINLSFPTPYGAGHLVITLMGLDTKGDQSLHISLSGNVYSTFTVPESWLLSEGQHYAPLRVTGLWEQE